MDAVSPMEALALTAVQLVHVNTGAKHLHIARVLARRRLLRGGGGC